MSGRARLGLLATLSTAYEGMPADLGERKAAEARDAAAQLERLLGDEVVLAGPIASEQDGATAAERLLAADPYAVVVLPTIATMASYPWAALEHLERPVLVWSRTEPDPQPRDVPELVYGSATVGATAIGNVLARSGRCFRSTAGLEPSPRALGFLRGARAAAAIGTAVFAHFGGDVWPGMLDVTLDREDFAAVLGGRFVDLEPDWSAPAADLGRLAADELDGVAAERSRLAAGAIAAACAANGVAAGAIHCHGEEFARNPQVGVVCCAAVSLLASRGTPFACTGDDCTAVALFLAQHVGGAAQYLEIDAPSLVLDACLVTSGGEADVRLAAPDHPVRLCGNRFFSGDAGRGTAVDMVLRPGAATLLGFTPLDGDFRVVVAEVDVLDAAPPPLGIPRAYLRFGLPAGDAFDAWCEAGANHHAALAPGRHAAALEAFADIVGIQCRIVGA